MDKLFSIKMRASKKENDKDIHISGAEKIIFESDIKNFSTALIERGFHHDKGKADFLNLKITEVKKDDVLYLDALNVETIEVDTLEEGQKEIKRYLHEIGIVEPDKILNFLSETYAMRGAMLLDVDRLVRLEPDPSRGIRATNMDQERIKGKIITDEKNHYEEAVVLATKVVNCPGIIGEICISDDPYYITGYVSSKEIGYRRITKMKEAGSENGGRIFLFRGNKKDAENAVSFLQNQHVIVKNVKKLCSNKKSSKWNNIDNTLKYLKENNLYRTTKQINSAQGPHIQINNKKYVLMASNDYLDIASHEKIKQAVHRALSTYGFGSGGLRLTTGNTDIHDSLEQKIADYQETQSSIVFNTGYVANLATIAALCTSNSTIFSDELNHASIIDGCRLSKAKIVTYKHNDMTDLKRKIEENPFIDGFVISDAVFSMDGDILNYPELLNICEKYDLFSMVDEAHSIGVIGKNGRGIKEYWSETRNADILMGTLSKAIGGEGGYIAGEKRMIDYLRNKARGYIFSTSLSPAVISGNIEGLNLIKNECWRVKNLQENVEYFCTELKKYGINVSSKTAIVPIIIGNERKATELSNYLFERGYYISAIRYPTVARGEAKLRATLMSSHTKIELSECAKLIGQFFAYHLRFCTTF